MAPLNLLSGLYDAYSIFETWSSMITAGMSCVVSLNPTAESVSTQISLVMASEVFRCFSCHANTFCWISKAGSFIQ